MSLKENLLTNLTDTREKFTLAIWNDKEIEKCYYMIKFIGLQASILTLDKSDWLRCLAVTQAK